jgi:hypothetical protein
MFTLDWGTIHGVIVFMSKYRINMIVGIPYVEQELHTLLENLNSFPVVSEVRVARSLAFCVMFCRQLFVILAFYFWLLYCLSIFCVTFNAILAARLNTFAI